MIINKDDFKGQEVLERVINHILSCDDYQELRNNAVSNLYRFEELRNEMNGYFKFNLSSNGGMIRLIFSIDIESKIVNLIFISMDHYQDFKRTLRK